MKKFVVIHGQGSDADPLQPEIHLQLIGPTSASKLRLITPLPATPGTGGRRLWRPRLLRKIHLRDDGPGGHAA